MITKLDEQLTRLSQELITARASISDAEADLQRRREHKLRLEGAIIALSELKKTLPEDKATE